MNRMICLIALAWASAVNGMPIVTDVVKPVLIHYPAPKDKAVGSAMIVAPGGGFRALMMSYEGADIAKRLNAMGVDAFVLKYRLNHEAPGAPAREDVVRMAGADGRRALRLGPGEAGGVGDWARPGGLVRVSGG